MKTHCNNGLYSRSFGDRHEVFLTECCYGPILQGTISQEHQSHCESAWSPKYRIKCTQGSIFQNVLVNNCWFILVNNCWLYLYFSIVLFLTCSPMLYFSNKNCNALFEVLAAVLMMIQVFWDVTSVRLVNRFQCLELVATFKIREVHRDNSFVFKTSVIV